MGAAWIPTSLAAITRYTKLFWINTGPYNNLTAQKFPLECSPAAFATAVREAVARGGAAARSLPEKPLDAMLARLRPLLFDRSVDPTGYEQDARRKGRDILPARARTTCTTAVTLADLQHFDEAYPLNSRLVKRGGALRGGGLSHRRALHA